jgi:hypothetical protein
MDAMSISMQVKSKIEQIPPGVIFGLVDFKEIDNSQAVVLELSRLSKKGAIHRLTKGKYFVPKKTKFGALMPDESRILDNIIKENGGYFAGTMALNRFGVTTQIPSQILVRGARSNRKLTIGNLVIQFLKTGNPAAQVKDASVTDLIEAAKLIKKVPDGNIVTIIKKISMVIASMPVESILQLIQLLKFERPYVRAIVGALLEEKDSKRAQEIKATLNPISKYKIGIEMAILPNKEKWGIL